LYYIKKILLTKKTTITARASVRVFTPGRKVVPERAAAPPAGRPGTPGRTVVLWTETVNKTRSGGIPGQRTKEIHDMGFREIQAWRDIMDA
jgi:hypothetical protein